MLFLTRCATCLPSPEAANLLLELVGLWSKHHRACSHRGSLLVASANMLQVLSRYASVFLPPSLCIATYIFFALTSPQVTQPSRADQFRGLLSDSTIPLPPGCSRYVLFCTLRPTSGHILFRFFSRSVRQHFYCFLHDSPEASQQSPIHFSALRSALRFLGHKCVHVPIPTPTQSFTPSEHANSTAVLATPLLYASFIDSSAADLWKATSEDVQTTFSRRPASLLTKHSHLAFCADLLSSTLNSARSPGIQRVRSQAQLLHSSLLLVPGFYVYALVSPLWSRLYVGATGYERPRAPLERWAEHVANAKLWSSRHSRRRFSHRTPLLYRAMAAVGWHNVVMVLLLSLDDVNPLRRAEVFFIRKLAPNFNVQHSLDLSVGPVPSHLLSSWWSEDVMSVASRVLRQVHPRLSPWQWTGLIVSVRGLGDRTTAAKLRRAAARLCPSLCSLRSSPRITFPCPVPTWLLRYTQRVFSLAVKRLPTSLQLPGFLVISRCTSAVWRASPYVTSGIWHLCWHPHRFPSHGSGAALASLCTDALVLTVTSSLASGKSCPVATCSPPC